MFGGLFFKVEAKKNKMPKNLKGIAGAGLGGERTGLDAGGALALVEGVREHVERCWGRGGERRKVSARSCPSLSIFKWGRGLPLNPGTGGFFCGFFDHSPATP